MDTKDKIVELEERVRELEVALRVAVVEFLELGDDTTTAIVECQASKYIGRAKFALEMARKELETER